MKTMFTVPAAAAALSPMLFAHPLMAYVGPGLGFGAIAAILGIVFSVFLAVFAMFWYPIKRLLGIGRKPKATTSATQKTPEQGE